MNLQEQYKVTVLCENDFLELRKLKNPEKGVDGYIYSHEKRCKGKIISILPYRRNPENKKIQFLLRREITPCWGDQFNIVSITGGVEKDDPEYTAVMETREEAGYNIKKEELVSLGTCFGTKSTDTVFYLYTVDLTNKQQHAPTTDGSSLEKNASCIWSEDVESNDPLVSVLYLRLIKYIG